MTCIEFTTESRTTYLVDVVNLKLKRALIKGEVQHDPPWFCYKELRGTGEIGKSMEIIWDENQTSLTTPVIQFRFVS